MRKEIQSWIHNNLPMMKDEYVERLVDHILSEKKKGFEMGISIGRLIEEEQLEYIEQYTEMLNG